MPTTQIMAKDHHDDFTTKIIKASTLSIREKKALIVANFMTRSYKSFP
jgi:hypothetical protein